MLLEPVEHPLGEAVLPAGALAARPGRAVALDPQRGRAGRDAGGVGAVLLTDDELRRVREQPPPHLRARERQLVDVAGDVDDRRAADRGVGPGGGAVEVDVEAEEARRRSGGATAAGATAAGRCSSPTRSRASTSGEPFISTARRARTPSPSAVTTPTARPPRTTTRATLVPVRTTAPASRAARTKPSASTAAPPTGTGIPTCCAAIASSRAGGVEPAPSTGTSAWVAWPASSIRAGSPAKRCAACASSGSSSVRASCTAPRGPSNRAARSSARGSGSGVSSAANSAAPACSHQRHRSSHAGVAEPVGGPLRVGVQDGGGAAGSHRAASGAGAEAHGTLRSSPSSRSTGLVCSTP